MNAIAILITFFAWACAFYVKGAVWSTLATILMNVLAFGLLIVGGIAYVFGTEQGNGGFVVVCGVLTFISQFVLAARAALSGDAEKSEPPDSR